MCLVVAALGVCADWPVVLVANRDEAFDRPTQPLTRHRGNAEHPAWLGGRDLLAGGTWMGASANGRVAVVTNVRRATPVTHAQTSRGALAADWLAGAPTPWRDHTPSTVNGCNLLLHDPAQGWAQATNCNADGGTQAQWQRRALGVGMHSMSNGHLTECWPKQYELMQAVQDALRQPLPRRLSALHHALLSRRCPPDAQLPRTGVPLQAERQLGSVFVHWPSRAYGTRSSAVLWTTAEQPHTWRMCEWTHLPHASGTARTRSLRWG